MKGSGSQKEPLPIDPEFDSIDSKVRILGYASRIKTWLIASSRYLAYTSDVGEAFRPIAHPYIVAGAYTVSCAYLLGDVGYEGFKAKIYHKQENPAVAGICVKRAIFQCLASMLFPALTIHSTVKLSSQVFSHTNLSKRVRTWGPTGLGIAVVPFLPFVFDHPIEQAIDKAWDALPSLPIKEKAD